MRISRHVPESTMSSSATILLVTVDAAFAGHVSSPLTEEGCTISQVSSGKQAIETYAQAHPDLVLLDTELPDINGLETCRRLIAAHGEECAPIIFVAVKPVPVEIAAAFDAGAADYLAKISTADEIRARLRSHLQSYVLLKQQKSMVEQLSRANVAKNRFIGMAAHDMRNPLVSIRGFSEFLMDGTVGPMPAVQLALVSIIQGTSNLMIKTLNELLDVATIEAGQLKLQLGTHNLADLIAKSVAQSKIEARKKRSRIEFAPPATSPVLTIDGDKIKQIIDNLLSNALKFSPAASTITVTIDSSPETRTCSFAVRDQGPGIPDHERDKLFKNFGKLSTETTLEEKSTGLGLVICRNIVEAHQGRITAENLSPKGCEFRVVLPQGG
jgi:two-component system, sensor histidine kinase and response regulator